MKQEKSLGQLQAEIEELKNEQMRDLRRMFGMKD